MPKIDISGIDLPRMRGARGPRARAGRMAFAVESVHRIDLMCDIDPYFGVSVAWVAQQLDAVPHDAAEIRIRINSYGGDVFEGVAIHNALAAHPARKVAEIIGCAASAASWIAMVADEILIWDGAMIMIHNSWLDFSGNASAIEDAATMLRRIDDAMAAAYVRRTGLPDADVRAMMAAETWMTAAEAVAKGFADRVLVGAEPGQVVDMAAPVEAKAARQKIAISPSILAGLRGLADAMAPRETTHA